jgi:uncharacterized protein
MKVVGFDWDKGNWPKCGKHGVTRAEIEQVFTGEPLVMPDPFPDEPRLRAIGRTKGGRHLFLVFMFREVEGQSLIRPISARFMHDEELNSHAIP